MDKLTRLQAMLGEDSVCDLPSDTGAVDVAVPVAKPRHLYEGTDSEDELMQYHAFKASGPDYSPFDDGPDDFKEYQLQQGQLTEEGESFCPWNAVKKYPYTFISAGNRKRVAENFFDQGKLYERTWDFFYLYRLSPDLNEQPILLIPTRQLQCFLSDINRQLKIYLTIPTGGVNGGFVVTFENDGTPQPRYLGRSTDREMADSLKINAPPSYYKLDSEPDAVGTPSERSLAAFRAKSEFMNQAQKGKKLAHKEKQKTDRIAKQQSWNHSIKRVQRYLGIREVRHGYHAAIKKGLENSGLEWLDYDAAVKAAASKLPPSAAFDPQKLAPFQQEDSVVFVCVDVEAYERNASLITEIGIATLDTKDITAVIPGEGGLDWMKLIRSRHFRINEYKHLRNTEFVDGCADRFEFGESEFINLKDAPHVVSTCFKLPFSKPGGNPSTGEIDPKRNIILVGHGVGADITFLRNIGYDVRNLSNLQEVADTATMWQYLKRDSNPRNLGSILAELGIVGWNLHNAGNDATYTLQAMIAIAIKHIDERKKRREIKDQETKARIAESVKEATEVALDKEQGWSSAGENSDGGTPITPVISVHASKQGAGSQNRIGSNGGPRHLEGPWRPAQSSDSYWQGRKNPWGSAPKTALPAWDMPNSSASGVGPSSSSQVTNLEDAMGGTTLEDRMIETKFYAPAKDSTVKDVESDQGGWGGSTADKL